MNKYLLWVLLASSSVPAHCHVFEFKEGTIRIADNFFVREQTWPMTGPDAHESLPVAAWTKFSGNWSFRWKWETRTSDPVTIGSGSPVVNTRLDQMFDFASTIGLPSRDWTDMGTYKFPFGLRKLSGSCALPVTIESDVIPPGEYVTYSLEGVAEGTSTSNQKMATFWVQCTGRYVIRKNVDIKLVDSVINLNGSTADELTGSTRMHVSGFGGPVTVQIDNPNTAEVSVSFDPNHRVTSTTMDLNQQPQYEQQIYVRGNASVPGRHEYRVKLIGEFK